MSYRWERRERKRQNSRKMVVDNRSIFVVRDADKKRRRRNVPDHRQDKLKAD